MKNLLTSHGITVINLNGILHLEDVFFTGNEENWKMINISGWTMMDCKNYLGY